MEHNCQNCSTLILNNFCDNCGQKKFKKIDRKYIIDEIQYTCIHMNKGLLYSVKNIIKNPGKTARVFVEGNRINHYKPILLVFLLSGISAFISFNILGLKEKMSAFYSDQAINSEFLNDYLTFTSSYSSLIMLMLVPIFAITTKLAFRKWGHNYYEHIVINAYIVCVYTLFSILIVSPLMFFFRHDLDTFKTLSSLSLIAVPFILVLFFKEFYKEKPLKNVILRVLLTLVITIAGFVIVMILSVIGGIIYAVIAGPEALKYIQPK